MGRKKLIETKIFSLEVNDTSKNDILPKTIISWNILSLKYINPSLKLNYTPSEKYEAQCLKLIELDADMIFLQEVDADFFKVLQGNETLKKYNFYCTASLEPYGQITLSKIPLNCSSFSLGKRSQKQYLVCFRDEYAFVNLHLMSNIKNSDQRYSEIKSLVTELMTKFQKSCKIMIVGDFNYYKKMEPCENFPSGFPGDDLTPLTSNGFREIENKTPTFLNANIFNKELPDIRDHFYDKIFANWNFDSKVVNIDNSLSDHSIIYLKIE